MFCPKCGKEISDKAKFCPECGSDIDSFSVKKNEGLVAEDYKKDIKNEEIKIKEKKVERKYSKSQLVIIGIISFVVIVLLLVGLSAFSNGSSKTVENAIVKGANQGNFVTTVTESPTNRNIRIANEIVANYHQTHTYSLTDLYVCGDMASDVWDMLKTQGINAKINVGNVEKNITSIKDANHAWVLAEVAPNQYLALEATGGYSITNNPLYYQGWSFYNPKQLKNYLQLNTQRNDAIDRYNSALSDYNNFVEQYNNANFLTQLSWKSQLDDKKLILNQRIQDLNDINQQISALLSNL